MSESPNSSATKKTGKVAAKRKKDEKSMSLEIPRFDTEGYYRSPTVSDDQIVFVSEDDLWTVPWSGGMARRLSSGLGRVSSPSISHDGEWLAFSSTEEGHSEIFLMPAEGGGAVRLTHLGAQTRVIGWSKAGEIIFASNHEHAFSGLTDIYSIDPRTKEMLRVPCGPATHINFDGKGHSVITRRGGTDLAYWKRYRGGKAGEIWIDRIGDGSYVKLLKNPANTARPFWVGDRIYFVSDHEGMGQVYSVDPQGHDMKRHTSNRDFYARGLSVSGSRMVYHAGGDIYALDVTEGNGSGPAPRKVEIDYRSPRTQTNRRFVSAKRYLEDYEIQPNGERALIAARGKSFSFDLWRGPVAQHGDQEATRYRLGRFMNDGKRLALISDTGGEETIEVHEAHNRANVLRLEGLDIGRVLEMKVSPTSDEVALVNHRNEILWLDLTSKELVVLDRSQFSHIAGFNWSPDGRYIAYGCSESERTVAIRIVEPKSRKIHRVTNPLLRDSQPYFDPAGEYLYFLSYRDFDPVYDNLHFDLGFPRGCRPYLLTLRKDVLSPFSPDHPGRSKEKTRDKDAKSDRKSEDKKSDDKRSEEKREISSSVKPIEIDFDGIEERLVAFPVSDGRYGQIAATREKVYFTRLPIKGSLSGDRYSSEPADDTQLEMYDPETDRLETITNHMTSFRIARDGKFLIYRAGNSLRVIKTNEKPSRDSDDYRRGGWLELERVQIGVLPRSEWRQMYREAWRLQRDHFWTEDMSKVDWTRAYERYLPLLERVSTRSEVSDVIWELQGELGTSHAYEIGGDYRPDPNYGIGFLGVDLDFDPKENGYRIRHVMKGDLWDANCSSPLARAGIGLEAGDVILAIDNQPLSSEVRPGQLLVHRAGKDVSITFVRKSRGETEPVTRAVRTLRSEQRLRYREWVEKNRKFVHEKTKGKVGYLHIPNMGPYGYSEFHRAFLVELDKEGLIIDVRFNGGGHVSQLLLEKLARRRIAYSKSRWFGMFSYPEEAPAGHLVALTNEYAGSDGDIFSHAFKLMKLGPLMGKRTWGGVIGISPSHSLVDGGMTTQPEYSFWFEDVGWQVENYGTEPDVEVEYPPADYVAGRDPQLEAAIANCMERIKKQPPKRKPELGEGPDLSMPV